MEVSNSNSHCNINKAIYEERLNKAGTKENGNIFLIKESSKLDNNLSESPSSHSKVIDILDTEYAAILTENPKEASFFVEYISMYRITIRPSLKYILLYRIGAYMRLFSTEDKRIEDMIFEQHNWMLTQKQIG